jgi:hypothetical protein
VYSTYPAKWSIPNLDTVRKGERKSRKEEREVEREAGTEKREVGKQGKRGRREREENGRGREENGRRKGGERERRDNHIHIRFQGRVFKKFVFSLSKINFLKEALVRSFWHPCLVV